MSCMWPVWSVAYGLWPAVAGGFFWAWARRNAALLGLDVWQDSCVDSDMSQWLERYGEGEGEGGVWLPTFFSTSRLVGSGNVDERVVGTGTGGFLPFSSELIKERMTLRRVHVAAESEATLSKTGTKETRPCL